MIYADTFKRLEAWRLWRCWQSHVRRIPWNTRSLRVGCTDICGLGHRYAEIWRMQHWRFALQFRLVTLWTHVVNANFSVFTLLHNLSSEMSVTENQKLYLEGYSKPAGLLPYAKGLLLRCWKFLSLIKMAKHASWKSSVLKFDKCTTNLPL